MAPANNKSNKRSEQHIRKISAYIHIQFYTFTLTSTRTSSLAFFSEGCCVFENSNIKITNWKNIVQNCYELVCLFLLSRSELINTLRMCNSLEIIVCVFVRGIRQGSLVSLFCSNTVEAVTSSWQRNIWKNSWRLSIYFRLLIFDNDVRNQKMSVWQFKVFSKILILTI